MADEPEAPAKGKGLVGKLGKKVGPLPVWGWALGVGGLVFLGFRWWSSKQAAASSSTSSTAVGAGTTGSGAPDAGSSGASGSDSGNGYSGSLGTQLSGLSGQLTNIQSLLTPSSASGGSGAGAASTSQYTLVNTIGDLKAAVAGGQSVYEQTSPGVYTPYDSSTLPSSSLWKLPSSDTLAGHSGAPLYTMGTSSSGTTSGAAAPTTGAAPAPVTSGPILTATPNTATGAYSSSNPIV